MTITGLSSSYFHAMLPDVTIATSAESIQVTILLGETQMYQEVLWAVGGTVTLTDLASLVEPWLLDVLTGTMQINAVELDSDGAATSTTATESCSVVYGKVDFDGDCSSFCTSNFLTLLDGPKTTSMGRLEYLHYIGSEGGTVTAYYSDGNCKTFNATAVAGNGSFTTLDVSPRRFEDSSRTLTKYVVTAGSRSQEFLMDLNGSDCSPCLLFTNSFGCQEMVYCRGTHKVDPEYTRSSTYINKKKVNYHIKEQRKFTADTGLLTTGEMNWIDDLFRSPEIYVVNFKDENPRVGRLVIITDSKSEFSNEWDAQNRATFTYQYAQLCQNVMSTQRAGRIFDNTFDNTFD